MFKKIAIVADHRGEDYKKYVAQALQKLNIDYVLPTYDAGENNDYPDVVKSVYQLYKNGEVDGLILLCGTGVGMNIAANKCKGIRCVWANNKAVAAYGRFHEDCNALALCTNYYNKTINLKVSLSPLKIKQIVKTFVTSPFEGGRHIRRVEKLNNL